MKLFKKIIRYLFWVCISPLFFLSKLANRNKKILVFGAWSGHRYSDNSKYLYEYIRKHHKDYVCVWLSKDFNLINELRKSGGKAYHHYSLSGCYYSLKCSKIFVVTGLWDVNRYLINGADVVNLWHGTPIKKIGLDVKRKSKIKSSIERLIFPFNVENYLCTVATSEFSSVHMKQAFGSTTESIIINGLPRNDVLECGDVDSKSILYMPTHRDGKTDFLEKFLNNESLEYVNNRLVSAGYRLVIRTHYYDRSFFDKLTFTYSNIEFSSNGDPYKELSTSAVLITDYSSVIIDYALTARKIILFCPDLDDYLNFERPMYIDFRKEFGPYVRTSWEDVLDMTFSSGGSDAYNRINCLFNSDTSFRFSEKLCKKIGIV